jgi:hypothetical protein
MPAKSISFFKKLEDTNLLSRIGYSAGMYSASYTKGKSDLKLDLKKDPDRENTFSVKDKNLEWDISSDGVKFCRTVKMKFPKILFGKEGIADTDSVLGLAVICTSSVSDRLEAFRICTFDSSVSEIEHTVQVNLSPGKYRGNAVMKTVVYLAEGGKTDSDFPKQSGTILGELDVTSFVLSDSETLFPVYEVFSEEPLPWWTVCEWTDIEEDPFTYEFVAVIINQSSKMYKQLSSKDGNKDYNPGYVAEVMSSAIQTIIEKIRQSPSQWEKIMSNATFPEGTIANMIQYMRTTLEFDFSSPERTAKSIRAYVYSRMVP